MSSCQASFRVQLSHVIHFLIPVFDAPKRCILQPGQFRCQHGLPCPSFDSFVWVHHAISTIFSLFRFLAVTSDFAVTFGFVEHVHAWQSGTSSFSWYQALFHSCVRRYRRRCAFQPGQFRFLHGLLFDCGCREKLMHMFHFSDSLTALSGWCDFEFDRA